MGSFSSAGYTRERLDEWLNNLNNIWYGIFGTNIDLSADTQDGQLIASLAEAFSNEDQKAEAVSKAFNPNESEGNSLSTLVTLNGIKRNDATYSVATLSLTGTDGTVIAAGSLVRNADTDEQFATDSEVIISGGAATVQATAVNSGAVIATAGSLTIIDTIIAGWSTVTNNNDATVGSAEESDAELRIRRRNSVAIASEGNVESVQGALLSVDGVLSSVVKENKTSSVDADGISAHSIAAIVEGGTNADIATTIWQKKSGGCNTFGSTTETITDSQGFSQDIDFSRPTDVDIYIEMTVKDLGEFPASGADDIKAAIIEYFETDSATRLNIGDDVIYSELYIPIMSVGGLSVTALTVDTVTPATGTADIAIAFDELARFDTSRIDVTVT